MTITQILTDYIKGNQERFTADGQMDMDFESAADELVYDSDLATDFVEYLLGMLDDKQKQAINQEVEYTSGHETLQDVIEWELRHG